MKKIRSLIADIEYRVDFGLDLTEGDLNDIKSDLSDLTSLVDDLDNNNNNNNNNSLSDLESMLSNNTILEGYLEPILDSLRNYSQILD